MKNILILSALIVLLVMGASVFLYLESEKQSSVPNLVGERYREITEPAAYINAEPFILADYIGKKVILLEFMTYSCANCQRSFPYLAEWDAKYRDKGLQIIGVHTPEFAFEHLESNVRGAMEKSGIKFPVVLDNTYATWRTYGNKFWPRTLLIDRSGTVVYDHVGVGDYAIIEAQIVAELDQ